MNIIEVKDNLFKVKKIVPIRDETKDHNKISAAWTELNPLNKLFKKDNNLFFCELIEEAIIID